jgi:hypothetical protein
MYFPPSPAIGSDVKREIKSTKAIRINLTDKTWQINLMI